MSGVLSEELEDLEDILNEGDESCSSFEDGRRRS
jgi:hypothetical protein